MIKAWKCAGSGRLPGVGAERTDESAGRLSPGHTPEPHPVPYQLRRGVGIDGVISGLLKSSLETVRIDVATMARTRAPVSARTSSGRRAPTTTTVRLRTSRGTGTTRSSLTSFRTTASSTMSCLPSSSRCGKPERLAPWSRASDGGSGASEPSGRKVPGCRRGGVSAARGGWTPTGVVRA